LHYETGKPPLHSILLHPEADGDLCGHFSNPYITLHLEDFDFFPNVFTSTFVVDVNNEVFSFVPIHVPTIVTNPIFHSIFDDVAYVFNLVSNSNIDDVASTSNPFIQVMAHGFNVVERINCEYFIMEMENVNKGGRRMSKHAKI
jgi:hypothetical protein